GAAVEIFRSQCRVAAAGGDRLQRAHGAKALGLASRVIDGPAEATAIFDFPYPGTTGASCSAAELTTGNGHRGTGAVPGRDALIAACWLGACRFLSTDLQSAFLQALRKIPCVGFQIDLTTCTRFAKQPTEGSWQWIDFAQLAFKLSSTLHSYLTDGLGLM